MMEPTFGYHNNPYNIANSLKSGTLEAGKSVEGVVVFSAPKTAKGLKILYTPTNNVFYQRTMLLK